MPNGHVLVVEDDDAIRRLLIDYLAERADLQVDGARDGVEALHQISTTHYAVVVLDLLMPKMSGVDFLDSLTAHMSDPSVKELGDPPAVIVITSASENDIPATTLTARSNLVRAIFRKPVQCAALASCVEEHRR